MIFNYKKIQSNITTLPNLETKHVQLLLKYLSVNYKIQIKSMTLQIIWPFI